MITALSTEWVAVVLGIITGVGIAVPILLSARLLRSKHPENAAFGAMGAVFGGLLVALVLMFAYRHVAATGFIYYALALVGGFVVCVGAGGFITFRSVRASRETET